MANIWLLFLLFPILTVVDDESLAIGTRVATIGLLLLFAAFHIKGYLVLVQRELGEVREPNRSPLGSFVDPLGSKLWFVGLLITAVTAFALAAWAILGVLPFIISFAMFHFSWPTAITTFLASLTVSILGPLSAGRLNDFWFFAIIVVSAGGAMMLTRLNLEQQERSSLLRTELIVSNERERVARDVHDVLGHSLTAIILKTQVVEQILSAPEPTGAAIDEARRQLAEMQDVSRGALAEIRTTVGGLRATTLSNELAAARAVLADADVALTVQGDINSVPHGDTLGWVVREAVTNIVRHARADTCHIRLADEGTLLEISDDGRGRQNGAEGNGIRGVRERMASSGLALHVEDGPERGTLLRVTRADGTDR